MKFKVYVREGVVLLLVALLSSRSDAQLVETGVIHSKTKDLGAIIEKAGKGVKAPKVVEPQVDPAPRSKTARAKSPPRDPLATFSSDTEDPASILDINVDVLTRFSAALAVETAKREDAESPLTRAKYNSIGAEAGGFTPRQYFVLKARVRPFCEAVAARREPPNDMAFSYMPGESMAIRPRCSELLPALQRNWTEIQIGRRHTP